MPVEFEINEETKEFLKTLTGPIGVISVAGMYRSGKSYLLNRVLLNRSRGFDVGHTINACTKVSICPHGAPSTHSSNESRRSLPRLKCANPKRSLPRPLRPPPLISFYEEFGSLTFV